VNVSTRGAVPLAELAPVGEPVNVLDVEVDDEEPGRSGGDGDVQVAASPPPCGDGVGGRWSRRGARSWWRAVLFRKIEAWRVQKA
jgi:hypothetical protein